MLPTNEDMQRPDASFSVAAQQLVLDGALRSRPLELVGEHHPENTLLIYPASQANGSFHQSMEYAPPEMNPPWSQNVG